MPDHKNLAEALFAVQAEEIQLVKNAENPHFKNTYVSLDKVMEAVLPVLRKHDILLIQAPSLLVPDGRALRVELVHVPTGESYVYNAPLELGKPGPQEVGSAITYMRRYTILSILGLVADEDDDGEKAQASVPSKPKTVRKSTPEDQAKKPLVV